MLFRSKSEGRDWKMIDLAMLLLYKVSILVRDIGDPLLVV